MSGWRLSRLYRPLGGVSVPKFVIGSGLVYIWSVGFDRFVFLENTKIGRISYLTIIGLCFLQGDHPLTLTTIAVPTTVMLRESLLASGGTNLLFGICCFAAWTADGFHSLRRQRFGHHEDETFLDRKDDRAMPIAAIIHQLGCWYFVPRANWIWRPAMKFLDKSKSRWLYVTSAFFGIGVWSLSGYWIPTFRTLHPRLHVRLVHYLYERPLFYGYLVRKIVRNHFNWSLFNLALGNSTLYQYRPLDKTKSEIRLLKLCAANSWDIVNAELISVPIFEAPPFEAISYRWVSDNGVPILLDGQRFLVSGEVHLLLRTMRFRLHDRLLWLDSICIDQENVKEKEWQVEFMTQIYGCSDQVIGWIAVMHQISFLPGPISSLAELGALSDSSEEFSRAFLRGDLCTKLRASILSLCNEFFFRKWIIQEVALAQKMTIKFGDEEIIWKDFIKGIESFLIFHAGHASIANLSAIFHTRMARAMENIQFMEQLRCFHLKKPDGLPLNELLVGSVDFEATDPRDRVFGVLGLSTEKARRTISISYGTDATDLTVSINAIRFTLIDESSFRLLELAGIGLLSSDVVEKFDGPSWIPRWDFDHIGYRRTLALTCSKLYKSATWTPTVITGGDYISSVLHIQGFYVDRIRLLSRAWGSLDHIAKPSCTTFEQLYLVYSGLLDDLEGASKWSLVWRTICHDSQKGLDGKHHSFDEDGKRVEKTVRDVEQQLGALLERGFKGTAGTDAFESLRLNIGLVALMHLFPMQGTRLCITADGYFGIVPTYAKEGDQIWAFSGGPNPFVLRASSNSVESLQTTKTHQLVGVCYIDGIMNGELERAGLEPTMVNMV